MTEQTLETAADFSPTQGLAYTLTIWNLHLKSMSLLTSINCTTLHIICVPTVFDNLLRLGTPSFVGAALVAAVERGLRDAVATRLACRSDRAGRRSWRSFGGGRGSSGGEADAEHGEAEEGKLHVEEVG